MNTIAKFSGDNMGGVVKIWARPESNVNSIELDTDNVYNLNLDTTDNIYAIYCSHESISFNEPEKDSDAGKYYEPELSAVIPKDTPSIQAALDYLKDRKWLLVYLDNNEYYKLAGEINSPLEFTSKFVTGKETQSLNHHSITFFGKTLNKSLFINNPFL